MALTLLGFSTLALTAPAVPAPDASVTSSADAGLRVALSAEDAEVVRDLELLEHLDEAQDLDLLHTL